MKISTISYLLESEQQSIRAMIHKVGWNEAQADGQIQSILHFLNDINAMVAMAQDSEKVAAFITCQYYAWNRLGQIHGLVVDPAYRRQGLAAQLVAAGEAFLRQKCARGVYVDTPANNLGGRKFYEACGYSLAYTMPEYYADGQDGVTYQKFFR